MDRSRSNQLDGCGSNLAIKQRCNLFIGSSSKCFLLCPSVYHSTVVVTVILMLSFLAFVVVNLGVGFMATWPAAQTLPHVELWPKFIKLGQKFATKVWQSKNIKIWTQFSQLHNMIANISTTWQDIVSQKVALQIRITPAHAHVTTYYSYYYTLSVGDRYPLYLLEIKIQKLAMHYRNWALRGT